MTKDEVYFLFTKGNGVDFNYTSSIPFTDSLGELFITVAVNSFEVDLSFEEWWACFSHWFSNNE